MSFITVPGTDPNGGVRMVHEADTGDPRCDTRGWTTTHDVLPDDFPICPVCLPNWANEPAGQPEVVDDVPAPTPTPKRKRKK